MEDLNMTNNKPNDYLDYLFEGAELNDSLLQSYRNFHLTLQSIFVAIGTGLSLAVLAFDNVIQFTLATLILVVLAIIGIYILINMRGIIIARGKDVNFWHRELIKAEQYLLPERRYFTQFKIYQRLHRTDTNDLQEIFMTNKRVEGNEIDCLIEKGLGHSRKILDKWLFIGIGIIWLLLLGVSIGYTVYRYANMS
jgi:hypothetical protein